MDSTGYIIGLLVIGVIILLFTKNIKGKNANKLLEQNNIELNLKLKECDTHYKHKVTEINENHTLLLKQKQTEYNLIVNKKNIK